MKTLYCFLCLAAMAGMTGCKRKHVNDVEVYSGDFYVAPEDRCPTNFCKTVKTIALSEDGKIVAYYQGGWKFVEGEVPK